MFPSIRCRTGLAFCCRLTSLSSHHHLNTPSSLSRTLDTSSSRSCLACKAGSPGASVSKTHRSPSTTYYSVAVSESARSTVKKHKSQVS
ncbi:hypothetical protein OH76DRAFT_475613 [Lentinus brumalis]|uniref:Uncharacterized protein n=1 Tax=Lentinus brumalis TaxID=2498619 RepID=A0A371CID4_9APHY|nr:hypothetical protein OH76DRAFT_475613 [Polyporus brumalis]